MTSIFALIIALFSLGFSIYAFLVAKVADDEVSEVIEKLKNDDDNIDK